MDARNSHRWHHGLKKMVRDFDRHYLNSFLFKIRHPRRLNLYGIGTPKSGTHSIRDIFINHFRSVHEPGRNDLLTVLMKYYRHQISRSEVKTYVDHHDRKFWVEVNSSCYNYFILNELLEMYPDAKFILTIRNPFAWLNSWYNHQLYGFPDQVLPFFKYLFKTDETPYDPREKALKKMNLPPVCGLLEYWNRHNSDVIRTVPKKNLLIVKTSEITEKTSEIIKFAGYEPNDITPLQTHTFKARKRVNPLKELDKNFLQEKVEQHCGKLLKTLFPEIKRPEDGLPLLKKSN